MARGLVAGQNIATLSLDEIAWDDGSTRKPLSESRSILDEFLAKDDSWIIEGCYSDLIEYALPYCEELRFLNPGIDVCIEHCKARPWEPEKFDSPEEQREMLLTLLAWVREYETREDEYGLKRHRKIYDLFTGKKREYTSVDD